MGIENSMYSIIETTTGDDLTYNTIVQKNTANTDALSSTVVKISDILETPSIEGFENNNNTNNNNNNNDVDKEDALCKFYIENKCYDQYVDADKNYYESVASIFNSIFPNLDVDIFKNTFYDITKWFADNFTYILLYKLVIGTLAAILFWSLNPFIH